MERPALSVAQFLSLVNQTLRTIPTETFCIEGEVSDFRVSQGKWINFDLKDESAEAKLPCFTTIYQVGIPLVDGMRVRACGYAKVFERFGKFSLNVDEVMPVGEGALAKAYALLKEKLALEGLFDEARKRDLPRFPQRVGLITSKEAAAYGDFLRILGNRWGGIRVLHSNVHVQGQHAVEEIINAFRQLNELAVDERPEVIVLTRGGGGLEDLHAFNDERTVRAVFGSSIPVIVGVGHERDETLCDFVADVRASTPSNAAERLVPDRRELQQSLSFAALRMEDRLQGLLNGWQTRIDRSTLLLDHAFTDIGARLDTGLVRLAHAHERFTEQVSGLGQQVQGLERLLESMNPVRVLDRGYAIVRQGKDIIKSTDKLTPGDILSIQLAQGKVETEVVGKVRQGKLL